MLSPNSYTEYVFGMDSSRWEDVDATPQHPSFQQAYDKGVKFNFLKATQGLWTDKYYKIHLAICKQVPNLLLGAYHFLQWDISPEKQAEYFWNTIKDDGLVLPFVVDFEWWSTIPSNAFDILYRFLERMKQLAPGRKLMIYTAYSFWKQYGKTDTYWSQYLLWLAHYSVYAPIGIKSVPAPWVKATFWQFTGHGDGYFYGMESKDVDLDFFMGTMAELQTLCGEVVEEPLPPDDVEDTGDMLKMKVIVNSLRIRSGSNTTYSTVGFLSAGEIVTVYDVAGVYGSWVKISQDQNLWCCVQNSSGTYLSKI